MTTQSDCERTEAILGCLRVLSQDRQIIVFTLQDEVLAWARKNLTDARDRVIVLDRALVPS